jgi:hypothetical protein|tara:strand:+ start:962 stop:1345 length:384 start_codon:yes stop_codon:yes gene_type:complete
MKKNKKYKIIPLKGTIMNKDIKYIIENMSAPMRSELMRKIPKGNWRLKKVRDKAKYFYDPKTIKGLKKLMTNLLKNKIGALTTLKKKDNKIVDVSTIGFYDPKTIKELKKIKKIGFKEWKRRIINKK